MKPLALALRRIAGDEDKAHRAEAALQAGRPAHEALAEAGAPLPLVELLRAAVPADLPAALEELAGPMETARARAQTLREAAAYPAILAGMGAVLALLTIFGVQPGMEWIGPSPSRLPAALALAADAALLVAVAVLLRTPRPRFPFAREREQQERALLLSAAAILSSRATPLPASLRAAAALAAEGPLRDDTLALAASLERGAAQGGEHLLGALGAGLFAASSARGAGPASLAALAELHQSVAEREVPRLLLRVQVLSLALGAAAVLVAGAGFFHTYSAALGGP